MRLPARKFSPSRFSLSASMTTLLDVLAHRVQVGRQRDAGREDALALLALALAVELLPPLVHVLEPRFVGAQNLDFPAFGIEGVARGGVDGRGVLVEGDVRAGGLLHLPCAAHQGCDVHAGHGQRQQPDGRQYREAAAHVVGNDEGLVALVRGEGLQCAAGLVRDGHDTLGGLLLAVAGLDLGLDQAEGDGRLGRRARFRDDDGGDRVLLRGLHQRVDVVFGDVLSGEDDRRLLLLAVQQLERVAHGLEYGLGAEVRAADADADDQIGLRAQPCGRGLDGCDFGVGDRRRKVYPAQEVVAGPFARFEQGVGGLCPGLHLGREGDAALGDVEFQSFHIRFQISLSVSSFMLRRADARS